MLISGQVKFSCGQVKFSTQLVHGQVAKILISTPLATIKISFSQWVLLCRVCTALLKCMIRVKKNISKQLTKTMVHLNILWQSFSSSLHVSLTLFYFSASKIHVCSYYFLTFFFREGSTCFWYFHWSASVIWVASYHWFCI
jgi:hypothetical protein